MPYQLDQIDPTKTVMIVVDMQNDFVAEGAKLRSAAAAAMVPKLASTLNFCREKGIRVIYTAHVHRRDGSDMGLYDDLYSPIADRSTLVDGTSGVEIFPGLAPAPGEHVIKKHRYSAFFATDLDLILREWGITTVIISGTTTENCCHATARDAMFNNYKVVFLSDATGSFDYPDVGLWGHVGGGGAQGHAVHSRVLHRSRHDGRRTQGARCAWHDGSSRGRHEGRLGRPSTVGWRQPSDRFAIKFCGPNRLPGASSTTYPSGLLSEPPRRWEGCTHVVVLLLA